MIEQNNADLFYSQDYCSLKLYYEKIFLCEKIVSFMKHIYYFVYFYYNIINISLIFNLYYN